MRLSFLATGNELVKGERAEGNAAWLASELTGRGLVPRRHLVVGDDPADMTDALAWLRPQSDVVVVSGGLGPTSDDITVDVMANFLGVAVEVHQPSLERARKLLAERGIGPLPGLERQARIPQGATVYENPAGLAPGFSFDTGKTRVFCFPGVPAEFKALSRSALIPAVDDMTVRRGHLPVAVERLLAVGLPESRANEALAHLETDIEGLTLGFLPSSPELVITFTVRAPDAQQATQRCQTAAALARDLLGPKVVSVGEIRPNHVLVHALAKKGLRLAAAESCTGGLLMAMVTEVPGSSAVFTGGVVSYDNEVKQRLLGVHAGDLAQHGAVSEPVALAMAKGIRDLMGTDLGVGITGIAGPDGGTQDKPVGTVFIAVADKDGATCRRHHFWPPRQEIRRAAAVHALVMVLKEATREPKEKQEP